MDVGLGNELVEEGVPLLVRDLLLDGDQDVLHVHDRILELHGALRHVGLLPGSLDELLLPLDFRLRDVFC